MSASVAVAGGTLGELLPSVETLIAQLSYMMTDESPGGMLDKKAESEAYLSQIALQLQQATQKTANLQAQVNILTSLLTSLVKQLEVAGVGTVAFSASTLQEAITAVITELGKGTGPVRLDQQVFGVMLVASTPDGARALQTLLGVGRTLTTPWSPGS